MLTHKLLGVIFDLDNTLVSSTLNFNSIRADLGCPKNTDLLDFVDELPKAQQAEAKRVLIQYEMQDAIDTEKLAGTDEIIALLSALNIPCAIVTRNCRQAALLKIAHHNIDIMTVLTREEHKAKPAPDALLHIAQCWNKPAENLLYVGDYLYDLQSAQNANTMSCLVTYGKTLSYADLATIEVNDLMELSRIIRKVFTLKDS